MTTISHTLASAADATNLSRQTIERAIKSGRLRAKRSSLTEDGDPTGVYVITDDALRAWIDSLPDA